MKTVLILTSMFSLCFYCMFIPYFLQETLQLGYYVLTII